MMIPASPPGMNAEDGTAGLEKSFSDVPVAPPTAPAIPMVETHTLAYADFAAAVKDALRDVHSPDLLSRNPLPLHDMCNLGGSAGPQELKALLCETVGTLFGNARDDKLRRVIELTYSQPNLKQEVVADRLSLSFGTYRRHLSTARDRLARWLWESAQAARAQPELPSAPGTSAKKGRPEGETEISPQTREPPPRRLSLVVLPFLNIGGNAEDDPFVDGIAETLTTDLSRCSGVFAISRNTAFTYKGKPIDTRQIGRELGVRYVLEGSVQNAGERIRFNAQLVDAESGTHLWPNASTRSAPTSSICRTRSPTRLAHAIHIELIVAESRRAAREHPDRLDSVDHTLQGWAAWYRHRSLEAARQARRFFEAALRLDEHNVGALLGLADTHMSEVNRYSSDDRAGQIRATRQR
jgi:TolB-like protein